MVGGFIQHQQRWLHKQGPEVTPVSPAAPGHACHPQCVRPPAPLSVTYRASDTLIRHPPENFLVALFCISGLKPRPARIRRALASAAAAPMARSSSYTYRGVGVNLGGSSGRPRCPQRSPIPSPSAQRPRHRLPPASPAAVFPPPATGVVWCQRAAPLAPPACHLPPPLGDREGGVWGGGLRGFGGGLRGFGCTQVSGGSPNRTLFTEQDVDVGGDAQRPVRDVLQQRRLPLPVGKGRVKRCRGG